MKTFALTLILLLTTQSYAEEAFVPICDRHPKVREAIETQRQKPCNEISREILSFVFELTLENLDPSELKLSDFEGMPELFRLTIVGQQDKKSPINTRIFAELPKLDFLALINIDLSDAPYDFLASNMGLRGLTLKNCNLTDIPIINGELDFVDLSQNQISELPDPISLNLEKGSSLELEDNRLTNIDRLSTLKNSVRSLSLAGNPISPTGCDIQGRLFQELKRLTINTSSINTECPLKILAVIDKVIFNGGSVKDFSSSLLSAVKKRSALSLSNFIIDDHFIRLFEKSRLTMLTLINTDLRSLRLDEIQTVAHLKEIVIIDQLRTSLPNIFEGASGVQFIIIKMPNLNYIPEDMFRGLPDLKSVGFTNTPLAQTSKSTFKGIRTFGLPVNFGVTDTGGTSEEWAP